MSKLHDILRILIHCLVIPFFIQQDGLQVLMPIIISLHLPNYMPFLIQFLHKCMKYSRANLQHNSVESTIDSSQIGLKERKVPIRVRMREYDHSLPRCGISKREV